MAALDEIMQIIKRIKARLRNLESLEGGGEDDAFYWSIVFGE